MDRPWFESYSQGIPHTVDMQQHSSLMEYFDDIIQKYSHQDAFDNFGTRITFEQWHQQSLCFAAYCQQVLGLNKGQRFAIMLPNIIQFPIALLGALRAGLIIVNINPLYTARELDHQLKDSGVVAIIVLENFAAELSKILANTDVKHVIVTKIGDCLGLIKGSVLNWVTKRIKKMVPPYSLPNKLTFQEVIKHGAKQIYQPVSIQAEDVALLQYTGGTTGVAKGAILTHRNILANCYQLLAWFKGYVAEGKELVITALPLYHIFSMIGCFFISGFGSCSILITNPRDIPLFVKILKRVPFTIFVGLNTLFNALLHDQQFTKLDFSHLHITISGGMALQRSVAETWSSVTGVNITEGYGLTEASPVVTTNPLSLKSYNESIGLPLPGTDVELRDEAGNAVDMGEAGELCVKGPQVMHGYWHDQATTKQVLTDSGWLYTGDIAKMDEQGYFYLLERKKDIIIVSGFNVYPNEVESVIISHPLVSDAAVVGVADSKSTEAIKAFIVRENNELTEEQLIEYCYKKLAHYKVPKQIEFRDELPKSNVGKVLRRLLRE